MTNTREMSHFISKPAPHIQILFKLIVKVWAYSSTTPDKVVDEEPLKP